MQICKETDGREYFLVNCDKTKQNLQFVLTGGWQLKSLVSSWYLSNNIWYSKWTKQANSKLNDSHTTVEKLLNIWIN